MADIYANSCFLIDLTRGKNRHEICSKNQHTLRTGCAKQIIEISKGLIRGKIYRIDSCLSKLPLLPTIQ